MLDRCKGAHVIQPSPNNNTHSVYLHSAAELCTPLPPYMLVSLSRNIQPWWSSPFVSSVQPATMMSNRHKCTHTHTH
eukprot:scaffold18820_cov22-Tisochrysis_lutea.AAC.1